MDVDKSIDAGIQIAAIIQHHLQHLKSNFDLVNLNLVQYRNDHRGYTPGRHLTAKMILDSLNNVSWRLKKIPEIYSQSRMEFLYKSDRFTTYVEAFEISSILLHDADKRYLEILNTDAPTNED